jgi:hypothetical protein
MQDERVDTDQTVQEVCAATKVEVTVGYEFPFGLMTFLGRMSVGGTVKPSLSNPAQERRALFLVHASGTLVLYYPDIVARFAEGPYAGEYGFHGARDGHMFTYHVRIALQG